MFVPAVKAKQKNSRPLVGDASRAIETDAASDGISARWAWAGFWFAPASLLGLSLIFLVHRLWFYTVQQEDYPIEWAQFSCCLFSGLVLGLAGIRLAIRGNRGLAMLLLLVGLGSLVLAGEEISWGQRVFGLVTPENLAEANRQSEMNLHNIDTGIPSEDLFELFAFAMGLGGVAIALLARRSSGLLHRTNWWLVAPPLLTIPGYLGMALYRPISSALPLDPLVRGQEWAELGLYSSLAITAGCCYARAARDRYQLDLNIDRKPVRRPNPAVAVGRSALIAIGVGVLLLTVIFAIMTAQSHMLPGNI